MTLHVALHQNDLGTDASSSELHFSKKEDEKCFIHLTQLAIRLFFSEVPTNMCKHVKHAYDLFGE